MLTAYLPYGTLVIVILIFLELRDLRSASNARAIALHLAGVVVPMLECRGYSIMRKGVSFGRTPYAWFNLISEDGIYIDLFVDEGRGYFAISDMHAGDGRSPLSHSFEVSGPWDELTPSRLDWIEMDFREWVSNGCRLGIGQDKPSDQVLYYDPSLSHYVHPGHGARSPTDIGHRLSLEMDKASPSKRYPLVPRLPRA